MAAYYNEIEPYAAEWLRNLIKAGHIADGEVDTRSIVDVHPFDLQEFDQCHFFAGIGGWSHALRLAGWPDSRPVWTGSCPCQPFSVAGKGAGINDERHLWPHFHRLIRACRPNVVMGEQVAGKAGYGWFDGVRADLEADHYSSRAVDIPALAVNAPHIRQRLYWVARSLVDAQGVSDDGALQQGQRQNIPRSVDASGGVGGDVENASHHRAGGDAGASGDGGRSALGAGPKGLRQTHRQGGAGGSDARGISHMADTGCEQRAERCESRPPSENRTDRSEEDIYDQRRSDGDMADADQGGRGRRSRDGDGQRDGQAGEWNENHGLFAGCGEDRFDVADTECGGRESGAISEPQSSTVVSPQISAGGFWSDAIWLTGSDGKSRRSKPGLPLLAHGVSNRVGRLRAYGNAIVPQIAAAFVLANVPHERAACRPLDAAVRRRGSTGEL